MKTDTLKVTALVLGILLVLISLYLNFVWHEELQQYRAAEAYLAERDRGAAECAEFAQKHYMEKGIMSDLLRIVAAQKGDAHSQNILGDDGWWWEQHPDLRFPREAREQWLLAAARQGAPEHQYALGFFYAGGSTLARGESAKRELARKAAYWYKEAALQGYTWSMWSLGELYQADGALPDPAAAEYWQRKWEEAVRMRNKRARER